MEQEKIHLSIRHVELILGFLIQKIDALELYGDSKFQTLCNCLGFSSTKELGGALAEIHREWNLGRLESLERFRYLDEIIYCPAGIGNNQLIKPLIFSRAEEKWIENLRSGPYQARFRKLQSDLRKAGGYRNLLKQQEFDQIDQLRKQESLRKLEQEKVLEEARIKLEQLEMFKEKRKQVIQAIQQLYPGHWNSTIREISAELDGHDVDEEMINEAKIILIRNWFSSKNLGEPSEEQAVVIGNCSNSLRVIARAGSGKTRTIAQKILFLVHFLGNKPDEILALVFNRKAKAELEQRVLQYESDAALPSRGAFKILTFDALAYNLIKPEEEPLTDFNQKKLIKQIILDAIANEEFLREQVERLMLNSFKSDWEKVIRLNSASSQADLMRLRSYLTEETIDGKEVKSRPEKRIADFLFEHDIPYRYEMAFAVDDGHVIRPDFFLPTYKIVIEFYGLRGDPGYEEIIAYKQQYWSRRKDIVLIEINPGFICRDGSDFDQDRDGDYEKLVNLLVRQSSHLQKPLEPQRLSDKEIIAKLQDRIRLSFTDLLQSAVTRATQMNCSDAELMNQIDAYEACSETERAFLNLLPKFLAMYKDRLRNSNQTDFNEIKRMAIKAINSGITAFDWDHGRNGIELKCIKYCFVDEFQDFSELFRGLLLAILNVSKGSLVNAVGDDWQMINRFAGSKPELFRQFDKDYPNPQTFYLRTNYRSAGGIVEFCNQIMLANGVVGETSQPCATKAKQTFSIQKLDRDLMERTPREDHLFQGDSILSSIFRIFKPITEKYGRLLRADEEKLCFAISRTNNPPLQYAPDQLALQARTSREIIKQIANKFIPDSCSKLFEAITAHTSKGLEANAVIMLQPKQFPMIQQRSMFLRFFGDTPDNLLRDELNLFYVACSRAKQDLYFLPEAGHMMSPFLKSLNAKIESVDWKRYPCRLTGPGDLHSILIQNGDSDSSSLYNARDILRAFGFDRFSRPNRVATRSLLVRQDPFGTLVFLDSIVQACVEFDLRYIVRDGRNQEIFRLPGPVSLRQAISDWRDSQ